MRFLITESCIGRKVCYSTFVIKLVLRTAANSAAIYLASNIIDGFTFSGNPLILASIGATLTIFQLAIYPIIKIIAFPIVLLSFGAFGAIANMAALWIIDYFVPQLTIDGIVPLIWGTLILSLVNLLFSWL